MTRKQTDENRRLARIKYEKVYGNQGVDDLLRAVMFDANFDCLCSNPNCDYSEQCYEADHERRCPDCDAGSLISPCRAFEIM